jgi:hypothetical protein
MRIGRLLVVALALIPLGGLGGCPETVPMSMSDGGPGDGAAGDGPPPQLRDVTFAGQPPGQFTQLTIGGVTLRAQPYQGSQLVHIQNFLGESQDLGFQCGAVLVTPPELHQTLALTFNDDGGALVVSVYDQAGALLTPRPVDTHADAQSLGIISVSPVYKRLSAMVGIPNRLIGSLLIASCSGFLHEIVLQ